jgi:competence protein ComEC
VGQKVDLLPEVAGELLQVEPLLFKLTTANTTWLLMGRTKEGDQQELIRSGKLPQANVLWWSGEALNPKLVQAVNPEFLIASTNNLTEEVRNQLRESASSARLLFTGRDGAISWTPANGIEPLKEVEDSPL